MTNSPFLSNITSSGDLPSNLSLHMGFLLNKAAQKIKQLGDQSIESYGITTQHLGILIYLNEYSVASQIEIGKALLIDRTTMVKMIDELEKVGYVKREKDPQDRRRHKIITTAKGSNQLPIFVQMMKDIEEEFLSPLSNTRRLQLLNDLKKLILK